MKTFTLAAIATVALAGAAAACPDYSACGASYALSGPGMWTPQSFGVTAGGGNALHNCGFVETGFFTAAPDFTFDVSQMQGYALELRVVSACDAALLINTPNGTWYYDDDSRGNLDPKIYLGSMSSGYLDVWVGTFDGSYCDATLTLETF